MDRTDVAKLKSALIDAFMLDAEEAIASCPPPITVSEEHEKRMREILSNKPRRRVSYRKIGKRVIALLVAALLIFLTGCAVFYQKIVDFIVTAFDKFSRVEQSVEVEELPQAIEDVRVPMVMLEGYELESETILSSCVVQKWGNAAGDCIVYKQDATDKPHYNIDNENSHYVKIQIGDIIVFYHYNGTVNSYVWQNGYLFSITSTVQLSDEEIAIIVTNIDSVSTNN